MEETQFQFQLIMAAEYAQDPTTQADSATDPTILVENVVAPIIPVDYASKIAHALTEIFVYPRVYVTIE